MDVDLALEVFKMNDERKAKTKIPKYVLFSHLLNRLSGVYKCLFQEFCI